jgi:hypothetical protein
MRRLPVTARTRIAREQVRQICGLTRQINALELQLHKLVKAHRPQLLAETGCGTLTAAILIGRTAGVQRFRSAGKLRAPHRHRIDPLLIRSTHPSPTTPRREIASSTMRCTSSRATLAGTRLGGWSERGFDASRERVDRLRELADGFKRSALPAGPTDSAGPHVNPAPPQEAV